MKQFFITGTSSGIGEALAEKALEQGHKVTGISRRKKISHENYRHLSYDLSSYENYHLINFDVNRDADEVILVNNAGSLGEVKPLGAMKPSNIEMAYQINLIAPSILTNLFLKQTEKKGQQRLVLNISSGAGKYPVASWSTYCASKAAIDLFSRVLVEDHPEVRCHAIAPGIVDTEMQGEIRKVTSKDFPDVERFKEYKTQGQLSSPKSVAEKIMAIVNDSKKAEEVVISLRDF